MATKHHEVETVAFNTATWNNDKNASLRLKESGDTDLFDAFAAIEQHPRAVFIAAPSLYGFFRAREERGGAGKDDARLCAAIQVLVVLNKLF